MTTLLKSLGKSLLLAVATLIGIVPITEGWPIWITIGGAAVLFLLAGFADARWQRPWRWYCGLVLSGPLAYSFFSLDSTIQLTLHPQTIDERNFYALLPYLFVASTYAGAIVGVRWPSGRNG